MRILRQGHVVTRVAARQRFVTASIVTGQLRSATFLNQEYLVMPVVALVEGVLFAVNAPAPELVLAEEFARSPQGWNGRPVMLDHPSTGDERVSANDPLVLERGCFGSVFNTRVEDKKLKMEAWLNLARAAQVEGASALIDRVKAGEMVEISVGVFVVQEDLAGSHHGKPYRAVWRNIVPDHLALLPEGTTGACSNDMGCGAPRVAASAEPEVKMTLRERFLKMVESFRPSQQGASDIELRQELEAALRAVEPGFMGVDAVFPDDGKVVYACAPQDQYIYFERSYTFDATTGVTLADDATEVEQVVKYEPVRAAEAAGCGCVKKASAPTTEGEMVMAEASKEKKDRVAKLVAKLAASKNPVLVAMGASATVLEQSHDELITKLETEADKPVPEPTPAPAPTPQQPVPAPAPVPEAKKPQTEEEFLASAPDSIKQIVTEHKAASAQKKTELVAGLKTAQAVFTEADLNAMDVPHLEKLARMAGAKMPTNFVGAGAPRDAAAGDDAAPPAPIDMTERIRTARGLKSA